MSAFYFKTHDNDGTVPADRAFEFPDLISAVEQAKRVLAEMALDGLPSAPGERLSIEVQNGQRMPIVNLELELTISYLRQS
ncbi:DUF6894 family protein [Rhizobium sp. BE258]|jgi:hypothetical protein|uniref:DUF6894 family protein n=1 Tax=unclassified Rhizobium TaxID=2613769 RepID=UPI000DD79B13|nr:hypothetical protein [Rhizobium sp. BE258]MDR7146339.1 hypothetical protein [Rhizobium sp. BE258]